MKLKNSKVRRKIMTKTNVLASVLYRSAVSLKNQNFKKLKLKRYRDELINSLSALQFLTHCVGMKSISFSQAQMIVSVLNTYNYDTDALLKSLEEASDESDFSADYEELLFKMHWILSSCINSATQKRKGYINSINLYIKAFHNFPRAFLSLTDKSKISALEAIEYSKSYLNFN